MIQFLIIEDIMWIDPKKFAKSIYEKWLQMCNAGVEDGLKELKEHQFIIIITMKETVSSIHF